MSDAVDAFERRLFAAVPALRAEMESYRQSYEAEYAEQGLEPPDVAGFLMDLALDSGPRLLGANREDVAVIRDLFGFLESELGHDPEVDQLIETMFLENLPEPDGRYARVLDLLGPKLRAARIRKFHEDKQSVPPSTVAFVHRLGEAVPALRERLADHIARHHGRPQPHAFMGEIVFDAIRLASSGKSAAVKPLTDFLESEFGRDKDVDNVIAVSFIEMLPNPGEPGAEIVDLLGPKLRAEYRRHHNWSAPRPEQPAR
jgi:hypothetical protein